MHTTCPRDFASQQAVAIELRHQAAKKQSLLRGAGHIVLGSAIRWRLARGLQRRQLQAGTQLGIDEMRTTLSYPVAGALAFTKYTRAQTWQFALFARLARVPYDVTRDCDYTDMLVVEQRVQELLLASASATRNNTKTSGSLARPQRTS